MIEVIVGAVLLILALVGGGVGWSQIRKHGEVRREREELEKRISEMEAAMAHVLEPDPTLDELDRVSKAASAAPDA